MSPVAYSRTAVAPRDGAMASASNGRPGGIAINGGEGKMVAGNSGPRKTPFRHVDDLVSVDVDDLDPHTPLRKILEIGDAHMRQATTYKDFRRPDLALEEYIKAFTIAVDKVPKHKDYPSLKSDPGHLNRLYNALKVKITANGDTFDRIKKEIKEDNRRSGVQPTKSAMRSSELALVDLPNTPSDAPAHRGASGGKVPPGEPGRQATSANVNGHTNGVGHARQSSSGPGLKLKPLVHPKPHGLHGNSISSASASATMTQDLATRFAKLRDSQEAQSHARGDAPLKPAGPRDMPIAHRPQPTIDSAMPDLPKMPDAIYSPARGTVTTEVANLPSSTPRGMFSRTNSIASVPSASARTSMENAIKSFGGEHFITAHTYGDPVMSPQPTGIEIPEGDVITAEDLVQYMKSRKAQILIIDARDRGTFDEGHIMSQRTICVEPEILERENISADNITERMVLAPPAESLAFEQRDKVDLVVVYDQESASVPARVTRKPQEMVLYNLWQALSYYSYSRPLKNPPKLLTGGLDAWVDELGRHSLATSRTLSGAVSTNGHLAKRQGHIKRSRTKTKTLGKEQVEEFEKMLDKTQPPASDMSDFDYSTSREDFLRRHPSVPALPESMTSQPKQSVKSGRQAGPEEDYFMDMAPEPPKRPKPAVPRTRYSGLESNDDESSVGGNMMMADATPTIPEPLTGLFNPNNWCYANSAVQAILASPGFADEMLNVEWPRNNLPKSQKDPPSQPQLMAKILGNLLQWLNKRSFKMMKASTFMYLRSVHTGDKMPGETQLSGANSRFGDGKQHDVSELITFIFDQLSIETNLSLGSQAKETSLPANLNPKSLEGVTVSEWLQQLSTSWSMVDRHWNMMTTQEVACPCGGSSFRAENARWLLLGAGQHDKSVDLEDLISGNFRPETTGPIDCDKCHQKRSQSRTAGIARLPPLLHVHLQRALTNGEKNDFKISFPIDDFDMKPYLIKERSRETINAEMGGVYDGFAGETAYDCYAIIVHRGKNANTGHYVCWVRNGQHSWAECNDTEVTQRVRTAAEVKSRLKPLTDQRDFTPVEIFYKRKDVRGRWE